MLSEPRPLQPQHVEGAKLYAHRFDMITKLMAGRTGLSVCEVGVAMGKMSKHILRTIRPAKFVACDIFRMHESAPFWGKTAKEWFGDKTHREFYEEEMGAISEEVGCELIIREGWSHEQLITFPPAFFDLIYLDADHSETAVRKDAAAALHAVKPNGLVIFNDYTFMDHFVNEPYGVIWAANDFVIENEFRVVGFALNNNMFCDLAVRCSPPLRKP